MLVRNLTAVSDEAFLARAINNWRAALERGDYPAFEFWAVYTFCFARIMINS